MLRWIQSGWVVFPSRKKRREFMKEKKKLSLPIKIFIGMALGIVAGLICAFANLGAFTKE